MIDPLDALVAERGAEFPITAAINAWRNNGSIYTKGAVDKIQEAMRHDLLSDHRSQSTGRMRPSSISNECRRFHALQFAGFEKLPFSEVSIGYMDAGTWAHYQWQAMLLSAYEQGFGGLAEIEVIVNYEPWKLRGSMDGQGNCGIFELKTVGSFKWKGWPSKGIAGIKDMKEPPLNYVQQVVGYMASSGLKEASVVCVSRDNNNDFKEFRIQWDQAVFDALDHQFTNTMKAINRGELPPMQASCERVVSGDLFDGVTKTKKSEWEALFDRCEFHHVCPKALV